MIPIPEELLEQIERGNVLLFIGERIVRDAEGRVVLDRLTAQLAARCGITDAEELAFPEAAQAYEDDKGRQALVQFLRDQLEILGDEPQRVHHLIASLTDYCNVLSTTCLNRRLERAFEAADRPLDLIVGNVDVAFEDEHKTKLYKLRGSLDRPELLILTEDDHEAFFRNRANLSIVLQGYLARKTILFIGYDLADPLFQRLYCEVTAPLDGYARRAFAFGESPSPRVQSWCKRHSIQVVPAHATAFLEELNARLDARARPSPTIPRPLQEEPAAPLPERPYKLLDYYEAKDAAIFFGRRRETQALSSLIHAHRLVLLYGASGVGKTSLLLAGVVPRLESAEPPYETIYVRALEDPALVIRRTVRRRLPEVDLPEDGPLMDFVEAATKSLDRTLVIVLDQFEEFFIRLSPEFRAAFIAELGALYDVRDVPVKVVLSLREDWLASVGEIETRIPEVFRTKMRLVPLSRDQARQAITAPVEWLGVNYEPMLVDRLLADLTDEGVMPPRLQLVCSTLCEGLSPDESQITLSSYEELGGAAGILKEYLVSELARLAGPERTLARGILKELIDSQGNKRVCTKEDLTRALGVTSVQLKPVLEKLVRSHLVRPLNLEQRAETGYELAHEYLVHEIMGWFDPQESKRKRVYELLRQDVDRWQQFQTPIAGPTLDLIAPHRDDMLLQPDERTLILRSAVQRGWKLERWIERLGTEPDSMDLLLELLHTPEEAIRHHAARAWRYMPANFSVDLSFVSELDAGQLSDRLRGLFQDYGVALTSKAQVIVGQPESEWEIEDAGKKYLIRSGGQTLDVSSNFGVDLRFVSELDAGQLSDRLRGQFQDHDVALTSKAQVIVEQPGSKWKIDDAGKKYLIRSGGQTLDVSSAVPSPGDQALVEVAQNDPAPVVRTEAAVSLAHRDPRRGVDLILNRARTSQTRRVEALAHIWDETAPLPQLPTDLRLPVVLALGRIRLKRSGRALLYHSIAGIIGGIIIGIPLAILLALFEWATKPFGQEYSTIYPVIASWLILGPWIAAAFGTGLILSSTVPLALLKQPKRWLVLLASSLLAGAALSIVVGLFYVWGSPVGSTWWQACFDGFVIGSLLGGAVAELFYRRQVTGSMPPPLPSIALGAAVGLVSGIITSFFLPQRDISSLVLWFVGHVIVSILVIGGVNLSIRGSDRFIEGLSPEESKGGWFK